MQEQEEEEGEEEEEQREKVGKQTERDEDGWTYLHLVVWTYARLKVSDQLLTLLTYYAPAVGGIKRYRDPSVCPSVCSSLGYGTLAAWRSCLGYRHAGCLRWPATRDVRTADPSADGRRSAASRTGAYRFAAPGAITC